MTFLVFVYHCSRALVKVTEVNGNVKRSLVDEKLIPDGSSFMSAMTQSTISLMKKRIGLVEKSTK
jgi:hypothetical protein